MIVLLGVAWGVFEATAGFLLHLLPFSIGAYVWFPAAYWFLSRAYHKTGRKRAVIFVALIAAGLKLLNLFSQVRIDYVINPAVSIVLEALAMILVPMRMPGGVRVFFVNTLWRVMYAAYAITLMPASMRSVSVVASGPDFVSFMVFENVLSSLVCVAVWLLFVWGGRWGRRPQTPA